MHHRSRHPNSSGGGGNPFTGRRLPANSPYRQQPDHNHNQSSQPNLNGMAKKALLIISSFCIFFYIVSGNGVDEQQYTSSGESQYTKDLNDIILKRDRKYAGPSVPAHGLYLNKVCYDKKIYQ